MDDLFPDLIGVEPSVDRDDEQYNDNGIISDYPSPVKNNNEPNLLNYLMNRVSSGVQGYVPSDEEDNTNESLSRSQHARQLRSGHKQKNKSRTPSPVEAEENEPPGLNRNAIMARLNRQKKKKYLQELETSVKTLKEENESLKRDKKKMSATVDKLKTEVRYLKGVIANQSELSSLLQNIGVTGLRLHSSFSHKTPLKPSTSSKMNLSMSTMKRRHDECFVDQDSDTHAESESEIENEQKQMCPTDHDYTRPLSSKEQVKHVSNTKELQHKSHDKSTCAPPSKVRKPNNQINRTVPTVMTRSAKTVITRSGQNVTQTVVRAQNVGDQVEKHTWPETRMATRRRVEAEASSGVCLHVSSGNVSLEFCAYCSDRAKAAVMAEEEIIEVVD